MNVWYLVYVADSLTYTIAKALSQGGHEVSVCAVGAQREHRSPDAIQRRLTQTDRVRFVGLRDDLLPNTIERLIVQVFPRPAESIVDVERMASRARRISLITAGDRSRSWRDANKFQWREVKRLARYAGRVDRVLYKDGWHPHDLLGLIKPRDVVGFDVHSQFLHDPALFAAMHARDWDPRARRQYRVNFLGSQDPASRKQVLDTVRPLFQSAAQAAADLAEGQSMYWHEYSDADPSGVAPGEFVRLLTESDFTLCPRGYSLVTHRPVEALLRGSIPVLAQEELGIYGIDLVDGENCIGVPAGRWAETIRRLAAAEERDVTRIRNNAFAMFDRYLTYDTLAQRLRGRVGVMDDVA
jgi:hypothetical protein